jgi:hypothetical protein
MFWAGICSLFDHVFSLSEHQRRYVSPTAVDVSKPKLQARIWLDPAPADRVFQVLKSDQHKERIAERGR